MLRDIYKKTMPKSFRAFVWRRVHDIRFLVSLPLNLPRQIYRNYRYKNIKIADSINIKNFEFIFDFKNILDVKQELINISFQEGEFAVYISDQKAIDKILPKIREYYPHSIGLKIIKSQIESPDGTPFYCGTDASETATTIVMKSVGSVNDKKIISNILSEYDVAPRVYDVVKIKSEENELFAMIVEHIDGKVVEGVEGEGFLKKFFLILEDENIKVLGGKNVGDFSKPSFSNNIIASSSGTYYVDIQNFQFIDDNKQVTELSKIINKDTHFGESNLLRSDKYSYQSVPSLGITGKRDSNYRLHLIDQILQRNKVNLKRSRVLDVGCNLGLFITYALYLEADWAVGLDMPDVAKTARKYMYKSGFSSFDIYGVDLKSNSVLDLLPYKKIDFIFYMSIEAHIGFPEWLDHINFTYILYEGHEGESIDTIKEKITSSRLNVEILDMLKSQDGDSLSRPLLLCRKV